MVMRSPCAGDALDPPLWKIPNKSLSLPPLYLSLIIAIITTGMRHVSITKMLEAKKAKRNKRPGGGYLHLYVCVCVCVLSLSHTHTHSLSLSLSLSLSHSLSLLLTHSLSLSLSRARALSLSLGIPKPSPKGGRVHRAAVGIACAQATAMRIDIVPHKRPRKKPTNHVPDPTTSTSLHTPTSTISNTRHLDYSTAYYNRGNSQCPLLILCIRVRPSAVLRIKSSNLSFAGKQPKRASASKTESPVLSELSGLEKVLFNDFIDDELDSEDVSEQRASASLPDFCSNRV
jgi:hypothetical protein